jgi:probable HAF family extracellular repeat protein
MCCLLASFALNFSFALLAAQSATAQKFAITDLGTLPAGTGSTGYAINESGQVTGYSSSSNFSSPQHAFLYSEGNMTDLGTLPGGTRSIGYGINGGGRRKERGREDKRREQGGENTQVTGYANTADGSNHAFLYSNGSMLDLGTLPNLGTGYVYSGGIAINESGQVTGYSGANEDIEHAFLYSNGTMSDLGTLPGGSTSEGYGINESGEVTGRSSTYNAQNVYALHAFLYSNGEMSDLGTLPGGRFSAGFGINNSGEVTGSSDGAETLSNEHAFLYSHGRMLDLGTLPGQTSSVGRGINRFRQVVGTSSTLGDYTNIRAFLYSDGVMKDLNDLIQPNSGWSLSAAYAINDRGQITGDGSINGATHAFLLTPVCSDDHEHGWRGREHGRGDHTCD